MPVVRTDGRAGGRCKVTRLPNFLGWVDYHISLAMGLRPRVELRYENREQCPLTWLVKMLLDSSCLPSSTFIVDEVFRLSAGNHKSISIFFCQSNMCSYFAFWEYENGFLDGWLNVHDSSYYQTLSKGKGEGRRIQLRRKLRNCPFNWEGEELLRKHMPKTGFCFGKLNI